MVATVLWGLCGAVSTADEVVRIMAANISSGTNQSYDGGEGSRIFDGLNPDIALVQEMNVGTNSTANYNSWVSTNFGAGYTYFVESGKNIPNGIVSRYPIVASGVWNDPEIGDREFVWARINLPGDQNLLAVSVHFKASSGGTNETRRNNQAVALNGFIAGEVEATDYLVIGGDFNTYSRNSSVEPCLGTLSSRVVVASPWPADQAGNTNTNASQSSPYDWVMPGPSLAALATPLVNGPNTHVNGLVFDSRDYTPLSAVAPVLVGDSGATGMQHMAVMRAFLIPTNDPPVITQGASVAVTLSKNNTPTAFSRSLNATDGDGNPLTWSIATAPANGTAGIVAPATGGTVALSYVPALNFVGTDSFVVQVADGQGGTDLITVNLTISPPPNSAPVITQGTAVAVTLSKNNTPTAFSRSLNATDVDGNPLTWSIATAATNGTAGIVAPATGGTVALSYVPALNFVGTDSFVVQVADGQGGTDTITVNLTISPPPNSAPVITQGTSVAVTLSKNNTPTAFSRSLNATDVDGNPLSWSVSTAATNGAAGIVAPATGGTVALSYVPALNFVGTDSFVVQVADGQGGTNLITVNLTIEPPPNVSPEIADGSAVAVTLSKDNTPVAFSRSLNATDVDGNPLTWSIATAATNGTAGIVAPATGGTVALSYVPALNFVGTDSFMVQVADGQGGTDTITVNLTISPPPNSAPVIAQGTAVAVTLSKNNTPTAFSRSLNATDVDGNPLSWSVSTAATNGAAGIVAPATGGTVVLSYVPALNYVGPDSITVQVTDGRGGSDAITVNLTVEEPPNRAPEIAGPEVVVVTLTQNGFPVAFQQVLAANDADADPLNWSVTVPGDHGTASVVAPASGASVGLAYQPAAGYLGNDSFTVGVSDGRGGSDSVVVQVVIEAAPAYDSWTLERFAPLSPQDEGTRWGENADPDEDGFTNLQEFAHGLDPEVADAAPNLMAISREGPGPGSGLVLSYKVRIDGAVAALDYSVMAAVDPATGWAVLPAEQVETIGEADLGAGFRLRTIRLTGVNPPPARFFRLRFVRHPEP
jgi:endonuclease/exonuclease/phosphatase family metal-dependent hydrolase